jgi:hypothetical protein
MGRGEGLRSVSFNVGMNLREGAAIAKEWSTPYDIALTDTHKPRLYPQVGGARSDELTDLSPGDEDEEASHGQREANAMKGHVERRFQSVVGPPRDEEHVR